MHMPSYSAKSKQILIPGSEASAMYASYASTSCSSDVPENRSRHGSLVYVIHVRLQLKRHCCCCWWEWELNNH